MCNVSFSFIYFQSNMDKRRNTLERWQKLGFGRRSNTNTSAEKQGKEKPSKGSDKTERLRELTELLRGSRTPSNPSVPPPIPPPRKQKSIGSQSQDNSSASSSVRDLSETSASDGATSNKPSCSLADKPYQPNKPIAIIKSLRPNTSAGQLECYGNNFPYGKPTNRPYDELSKSPPLAEKEDDLFTALPKAESRTIVGSYTQKSIPFRSASFSQVDYSSGKYIRSAIGAFKATLKSNKEPSVIENTNLTLPRKKDRQSPENSKSDEASSTNSPNRVYKSEMSVVFQPNRKLNETMMVDGRLESKFYRESLIEENENEADDSLDGLTIVNASEMVIESPSERGILMATPPQDEFLQTATTCLIPLPVYECANREDAASEQWINACDEDSTKLFEEVNVESDVINEIGWDVLAAKSSEMSETKTIGEVIKDDITGNESSDMTTVTAEADTISVAAIQSEIVETISNEIEVVNENPSSLVLDVSNATETCENVQNEIDEHPIIPVTIEHANESTENLESKSEFVEVRKRHNNDDKTTRQSVNLSNSSESVNSVATGEDRRRIDKSKRRKGIYFQWPAVEKDRELDVDAWSHADSSSPILSGTTLWEGNIDIAGVASPCKVDLTETESHLADNSGKVNEPPKKISVDLDTANFFAAAFESTTPDSEISRPAWPKILRKQNSDERDDISVISAISDKQYHKISFMRQDSVSDNETDKTPPPHDRVSQSQSNDPDLKRYSKRPLRGPYGQMLEAEMKKPAKSLLDEMFNRSERYG